MHPSAAALAPNPPKPLHHPTPHHHHYIHRPPFDTILARLMKMRGELGIPTTPPLQRYKLKPKVSQEGRYSGEKV